MVNPDKVLEAEEGIRAIAAELERMRSAAQTLESAEERARAVVEASKSIIEIGNRLVGELDAASIASIMEPRFDALNERADQLSEDVKVGLREVTSRLDTLKENTDRLSEDVKAGLGEAASRLDTLKEHVETVSGAMTTEFEHQKPRLARLEVELRSVRMRQIVVATFAIATFVAACGGIAVGVLFGS